MRSLLFNFGLPTSNFKLYTYEIDIKNSASNFTLTEDVLKTPDSYGEFLIKDSMWQLRNNYIPMKKPARILILIACAFLIAVFFVPIWQIHLDAPQYPGGLDMYIWIDKITGTDEFTLQNINILNHYIGMQAIHPDSFKELEIMPYVVIFFIITGVITAFVNKKNLIIAWLAILIIGGTVGLVDFYLWQQAFGNELDPTAPIKVEGMSYSPPFIGVKTLLNITAMSFPHWGGVFFFLASALVMLALFVKVKGKKKTSTMAYTGSIAIGLLLLFSACKPEAQAIDYGFDSCTHCKMTIADDRYGSELVTEKGKVYKFDAIECLATYLQAASEEQYAMLLVTDFSHPGDFIDAKSATYLQSEALPSPMGMNLSAFVTEDKAKEIATEHAGEVMRWEQVKELKMGGM